MVKILTAAIALSLALTGCGHSEKVRTEAKEARARILSLVAVGSSLSETETKLKNAGFRFVYPKPIDATGRGGQLEQLVCVHPEYATPTSLDSFRYTVGIEPPKSEPAPYIVIEANSDGVITNVR